LNLLHIVQAQLQGFREIFRVDQSEILSVIPSVTIFFFDFLLLRPSYFAELKSYFKEKVPSPV
jgi:hypothetical protein